MQSATSIRLYASGLFQSHRSMVCQATGCPLEVRKERNLKQNYFKALTINSRSYELDFYSFLVAGMILKFFLLR